MQAQMFEHKRKSFVQRDLLMVLVRKNSNSFKRKKKNPTFWGVLEYFCKEVQKISNVNLRWLLLKLSMANENERRMKTKSLYCLVLCVLIVLYY